MIIVVHIQNIIPATISGLPYIISAVQIAVKDIINAIIIDVLFIRYSSLSILLKYYFGLLININIIWRNLQYGF